jgi:hypothetical protein
MSHASRFTMMYRLTLDRPRDDHLPLGTIFSFRHADFIEAKNQFGLHPLHMFSQATYRFISKSTWHFWSRVFLCGTFRFK